MTGFTAALRSVTSVALINQGSQKATLLFGIKELKGIVACKQSFALLVAILPFYDALRDLLRSKGKYAPLFYSKSFALYLALSLTRKVTLRYQLFSVFNLFIIIKQYVL